MDDEEDDDDEDVGDNKKEEYEDEEVELDEPDSESENAPSGGASLKWRLKIDTSAILYAMQYTAYIFCFEILILNRPLCELSSNNFE